MKEITDLAADARSCIENPGVAGVDREQADAETATVARWSVGGIFLEALANRDSWLCVCLPLHEDDPMRRLATIGAETAMRKREHDADSLDAIMRDFAGISRRLERFAERLAAGPRMFALNVSNVPGPREPIQVLGCRVRSMHSLAEVAQHHALRVAAISLAGTMQFGLCADAEAVGDVETLAEGIERAVAELLAATA